MVPSDPLGSLSSNRHARSGRGAHIAREQLLSLLITGFSRLWLTASEASRRRFKRNRLLQSDLSLACRSLRLATFAPAGSTLPACSFEVILSRSLARSVSS